MPLPESRRRFHQHRKTPKREPKNGRKAHPETCRRPFKSRPMALPPCRFALPDSSGVAGAMAKWRLGEKCPIGPGPFVARPFRFHRPAGFSFPGPAGRIRQVAFRGCFHGAGLQHHVPAMNAKEGRAQGLLGPPAFDLGRVGAFGRSNGKPPTINAPSPVPEPATTCVPLRSERENLLARKFRADRAHVNNGTVYHRLNFP